MHARTDRGRSHGQKYQALNQSAGSWRAEGMHFKRGPVRESVGHEERKWGDSMRCLSGVRKERARWLVWICSQRVGAKALSKLGACSKRRKAWRKVGGKHAQPDSSSSNRRKSLIAPTSLTTYSRSAARRNKADQAKVSNEGASSAAMGAEAARMQRQRQWRRQ